MPLLLLHGGAVCLPNSNPNPNPNPNPDPNPNPNPNQVLEAAPGIRVVDDRVNNQHPEPQKVSGLDEILVSSE